MRPAAPHPRRLCPAAEGLRAQAARRLWPGALLDRQAFGRGRGRCRERRGCGSPCAPGPPPRRAHPMNGECPPTPIASDCGNTTRQLMQRTCRKHTSSLCTQADDGEDAQIKSPCMGNTDYEMLNYRRNANKSWQSEFGPLNRACRGKPNVMHVRPSRVLFPSRGPPGSHQPTDQKNEIQMADATSRPSMQIGGR